MPKLKLGLYPLSAEDLLMSMALFETIVRALEAGTREECQSLARRLRAMRDAPYA